MENKIIVEEKKLIVRKPRSTKNYINGADLQTALQTYYDKCDKEEKPIISDYIGKCLIKIASNLKTKYRFSGYPDYVKQEMEGDALEKMLEAVVLKKYDTSLSSNPFGYFTQVAWNCFLQRVDKEIKQTYAKHKCMDNEILNIAEFQKVENINFDNDYHSKVIEDFERPKEKNSGYVVHRNLSYNKNKKKDLTPIEK